MENKEIAVQKYGGSSVADLEKMMAVAENIKKTAKDKRVAVVVSAMGDETDRLMRQAREIFGPEPPKEELDRLLATGEEQSAILLTMALKRLGLTAVFLNGCEINLEADHRGRAKRVGKIDVVKNSLNQDKIAVITGFQGVIEGTKKVITLGRGGSDLTAVALAAALGLDCCEIYTDVDGVYTIDPRIVPEAKKFEKISYRQMIELSGVGAGVLMSRCVILAQNLGVKIRVLLSPSFGESIGGTLVCSESSLEEMESSSLAQSGVAIQNGSLIRISNVLNNPGMAAKIFNSLSEFSLIDSAQGMGGKTAEISIICLPEDLDRILAILKELKKDGNAGKIKILKIPKIAELTFVDILMQDRAGYLARVFGAAAKVDVNILMHSTASSAISIIVKEEYAAKAAMSLGEEFNLLA